MHLIVTLALLIWAAGADAATLQVGPGRTYSAPCAAILAAASGDIIEIDGADGQGNQLEYVNDFCTWSTTNLTIRGVGARRPHIRRAITALPGNQGIWRPTHSYGTVTTLTVENLEMSGAHSTQLNAQPIWPQYTTMIVRNVYFHHNDNGFLGFNEAVAGASRLYDITIENSEFAYNGGVTMGANLGGNQHNVYVGAIRTFTITGSWIHDSVNGQDIKSRANTTFIRYNRIGDWVADNRILNTVSSPGLVLTGHSNYEIDCSVSATLYVIGNLIVQASASANKIMLIYARESQPAGQENTANELYVTNNTFVDLSGSTNTIGLYTYVAPTAQVILNNIFAGFVTGSKVWAVGAAADVQPNPADNRIYATVGGANFINALNQNYHLGAASTAINRSVPAGSANGNSLTPVFHYVHPLSTAARTPTGTLDVGAYETTSSLGVTIPAPILWTDTTPTAVTMTWTPSLSDVSITQYRVLRDGAPLATVTGALTYSDTTAVAGTTYTYTVIADTAGGSSPASNAVLGIMRKQVTGALDAGLGWQEVLSTTMDAVITPAANNMLLFYNGAITLDTQSNRLLIWNNGQIRPDNSVYALNLDTMTPAQVNTSDINLGTGDEIIATGRPNARQTFSALAWIPTVNKMFGGMGYVSGLGYIASTWLWTPGTDTWEKKTPTGTLPSALQYPFAEYDTVSQSVVVANQGCVRLYDPVADSYTAPGACVNLTSAFNGAIDPVHRRLYVFGMTVGGYFDLTNGAFAALPGTSGCGILMEGPGLAWDAGQEKMVGWTGGPNVIILDPVTNVCTVQEVPGHPGWATVTAAYQIGRRFLYVPSLSAFLGFTETNANAYALRLSPIAEPPVIETSGRHGGGSLSGGGRSR